MKFYYKETLIRTSKGHVYTHAVINQEAGTVIGCRTSEKAAQQLKQSYINRNLLGIENARRAINAIENGKRFYRVQTGRDSYLEAVGGDKSKYEKWIAENTERIQRITAMWKVVPLEARE
jgi:hypothetical protein